MKWINVKKQLPNKDKMVLCFLENCGIRMMYYMGKGDFAEPWQGGKIKVKYWMKLPKAPTE